MLRIRNNGKIQEIKIPSDKLEVIQKIVKSNVSDIVKANVIKRFSGGICCCCGTIATLIVSYDESDEKQAAKRIEIL